MDTPLRAYVESLDTAAVAAVIRRAHGAGAVDVADWRTRQLSGRIDKHAASAAHLVTGLGPAGAKAASWHVVLKLSCPIRREKRGGCSRGRAGCPAARERHMYTSGLLAPRHPDSVVAPRCLGAGTTAEGVSWCWLEHVTDVLGPEWPLVQYPAAARHFGVFNGSHLRQRRLRACPWLNRRCTRQWVANAGGAVARLQAGASSPTLRRVYPPRARAIISRLWSRRAALLGVLEAVPQTLCHHDAFRRNLFASRGTSGRGQTIAVDWASSGVGAIGEDLAPFIVDVPHDRAKEIDAYLFQAYLDGLRMGGWTGGHDVPRFGYAAAASLRYLLGSIPLVLELASDGGAEVWEAQRLATQARSTLTHAEALEQCADSQEVLLGLAEEARRLACSVAATPSRGGSARTAR